MAWYANRDDSNPITLGGTLGGLLRLGIWHSIELFQIPEMHLGGRVFESLTYPARVMALGEVATALLVAQCPPPSRRAYHEATLIAIFETIRTLASLAPIAREPSLKLFDGDDLCGVLNTNGGSSGWEQRLESLLLRLLGNRDVEEYEPLMDADPSIAAPIRRARSMSDDFFWAMPPVLVDAEMSEVCGRLRSFCRCAPRHRESC